MEQQTYRKVFVAVTLMVSPSGEIRPLTITFEDGTVYEVSHLKQRCRAHAMKVGGTGNRYTVVIQNHQTYLFEDAGRWYVEARNAG